MSRLLFCVFAGMLGGFLGLMVWATVAAATVGEGIRWPRYDSKPVKLHLVTDTQFDRTLLPQLKDAAKAWEQTGDLRFDFPRPVKDCDRNAQKQNTICVSSTNLPCPQAGGCSWFGPLTMLPDGMRLFSYGRLWINMTNVIPGDTGWIRHVFCHEIGHNIGLDHSELGPTPYPPSCMSNDFTYYSERPSQDDLEFVHLVYAVRDTG